MYLCVFVFVLSVYLFSDDLCFPGTAEIGDAPKAGDRNAGLGRSVVLWFCLYLCFLCISCCFLCIYGWFLFFCLEPTFAYSVLASYLQMLGREAIDVHHHLDACICMCFRYLRVFVFRTLVSRWPAGKRASNYKWATGATKLLLLAAPFVRNFTPKKVRS